MILENALPGKHNILFDEGRIVFFKEIDIPVLHIDTQENSDIIKGKINQFIFPLNE